MTVFQIYVRDYGARRWSVGRWFIREAEACAWAARFAESHDDLEVMVRCEVFRSLGASVAHRSWEVWHSDSDLFDVRDLLCY